MGSEAYDKRQLSDIKYLVIHHSAVDIDNSALEVARYHVDKQGWPGIGYHFLAHWDGGIDYAGDIETIRYNVAKRNVEVVGICLPGNFTYHWPYPRQLRATYDLVKYLRQLLPGVQVVGHRDIAVEGWSTSCPGDMWPDWKSQILKGD